MTQDEIQKTKTEAIAVINPVLSAAAQIAITDSVTYGYADAFLKKIKTAKRGIEDKLSPIIDPIRRGLDELYALKRELDAPLIQAEADVKGKMKVWQLAEAQRVAEEEAARRREDERLRAEAAARQREEERLRMEAENKRRQAEAAGNEAARRSAEIAEAELRARQEAQAAEARRLELAAEAARAKTVVQVVKGASSSARKVRKWRVADMDVFVAAVAAFEIPQNVLAVDATMVNQYFKVNEEIVADWPGVEVYDDIVIAGR